MQNEINQKGIVRLQNEAELKKKLQVNISSIITASQRHQLEQRSQKVQEFYR